MRILFMGTPDIAAEALKMLIKEKFDVVGVVTQPDKPRGRKQVLTPPETKTAALEYGIPVFQPEKLKNGELEPVLNELKPDLIAVVAYGKILPEYVLDFPKYGCINMHGSLLPKYRGAAPIQWAVINGEKTTGVTTMKMDKGLDTGDMLISRSIDIDRYETSGELFERIAALGAETLAETINNIDKISPVHQNDAEATYAPIIKKEMAEINWSMPSDKISKLICGMNPWPVAYTHYNGETLKIFRAEFSDEKTEGADGEIICADKNKGLKVKCGKGCIFIHELQFSGSKRMMIGDYLRGHSFENGAVLK